MKMEVPPRIEVLTRRQTMFQVVAEISQLFREDKDIEAIRKGILQEDIIEMIFFMIKNRENKVVMKFTITIDWKTHKIRAESGTDKFEFKSGVSVTEQVIDSASDLAMLVKRFRDGYPGSRVASSYRYREEIRDDPIKHKEAREFLGHVPTTPEDEIWYEPKGGRRFVDLNVTPARLDEIALSVRGVTPLDKD